MPYFSEQGGEVLRNVARGRRKQYTTQTLSIGARLLDPFWTWSSKLAPAFLAPNIITMMSVASIWGVAAFMLTDNGVFDRGLGLWGSLLGACGVFVFQWLDALDGLHARQTQMTSPIGDFLDHFVDSYCNSALTLLVVAGIQGGTGWILVIGIIAQEWASFSHNWEAKHANVFIHDTYMSITEAQLSTMALLVITAVLPHEIWVYKLPIVSWPVGVVIGYAAAVVICGPMIVPKLIRVLRAQKSMKAALEDLSGMTLFSLLLILMQVTAVEGSNDDLERIILGLIIGGRIVGQMILGRLVEDPVPKLPLPLLPLLIITLSNVFFPAHIAVILRVVTLLSACELTHYFLTLISDMAKALGIPAWGKFTKGKAKKKD